MPEKKKGGHGGNLASSFLFDVSGAIWKIRKYVSRVEAGAPVYLAAVLEYLILELIVKDP
jgi:hypothetical protein